jgi:hypothetical protein
MYICVDKKIHILYNLDKIYSVLSIFIFKRKKGIVYMKRRGISLIVLVITIIVIIILAGTIILNLVDDNPILKANEAKFKTNMSQYNEELTISLSKNYGDSTLFDPSSFDAGVWNGDNEHITGTIKQYIPSITVQDALKFEVVGGKLVYIGTDESEIVWANSLKGEDGGSGGCTSGHTWVDANYLYPKTCSVCGTTEGEKLDIATATKHPSQTITTNIGIGADGQVVNLDLWEYAIITSNTNGYYVLNTYELDGYLGTIVDGKIVGSVPQLINGIEVTRISYALSATNLVTPPKLPSCLTAIESTFEDCTLLTTAPVIPSGVKSLNWAFRGCSALTSAPVIPDGVVSLSSTFSGCSSITVPPSIPDGAVNIYALFMDCISLTTVTELPSAATSIDSVFYGCTSITTAPIIPDTVTNMYGAFEGCTSLTSAPVIPDSVTSLSYTFYGCTGLTSATMPIIPNNVQNMRGTFSYCTGITTTPHIPDSVKNMYGTFAGCTGITAPSNVPAGVTDMNKTFMDCTSLTSAPVMPSGATNLYCTFKNCTSLTAAPVIQSAVTQMNSTFYGCTNLIGTVQVNASSVSVTSACFYGIAKNITLRVPTGSTTSTNFTSAYGTNPLITIVNY